jgi:hypothetical protein
MPAPHHFRQAKGPNGLHWAGVMRETLISSLSNFKKNIEFFYLRFKLLFKK